MHSPPSLHQPRSFAVIPYLSKRSCTPASQVDKLDLLIWLAAFFGVIFISVEIGLAISIGLAVLLVVYQVETVHRIAYSLGKTPLRQICSLCFLNPLMSIKPPPPSDE